MTETKVKCNCFDVFYVCTLIFRLSFKAKEREENNYMRFECASSVSWVSLVMFNPSIHSLTHSLKAYLPIHPPIRPSVRPPIYPSVHPFIHLSFSIYPSIHSAIFALSVPLSIYSSIHSTSSSLHPCVILFVRFWADTVMCILQNESNCPTWPSRASYNRWGGCLAVVNILFQAQQYYIKYLDTINPSFGRDPSPEKKLSNACHKLLYCPFSAYLACDQLFIIDWWFLLQTIPLHCVVLEGIHLLTSPGDT